MEFSGHIIQYLVLFEGVGIIKLFEAKIPKRAKSLTYVTFVVEASRDSKFDML